MDAENALHMPIEGSACIRRLQRLTVMHSYKNRTSPFGTDNDNETWDRTKRTTDVRSSRATFSRFFMPRALAIGTAIALGSASCLGVTAAHANEQAPWDIAGEKSFLEKASNPYALLSEAGYPNPVHQLTTSANTVPASSVEGYTLADFVNDQALPPTKELYEKAATAGYDTSSGSITQPILGATEHGASEGAGSDADVNERTDAGSETDEVGGSAVTSDFEMSVITMNDNAKSLSKALGSNRTASDLDAEEGYAEEADGDAEAYDGTEVLSETDIEEASELSRKLAVGKADNQRKSVIKVNEEERVAKEARIAANKEEQQLNDLIIQAAESQLGTPYVWGGTTPGEGLDCSGFTQYCYSTIGIDVSRTSETQFANAIEVVPVEEAERGDILYTSGHVGIYVGDDEYIHAPTSGDVVRYASGVGSFSHALRFTGTVSQE